MKRAYLAIIVALMFMFLASCDNSGNSSLPPVEEITQTVAPTPDPLPTPSPDPLLIAVSVELKGKDVTWKDADAWRFSDRVNFDFDYTNNSDKEIRGFQGVITFYDMFNKEIISLSLENTDSIPAGEGIDHSDMYVDINEYMDEYVKLRDTKFEDMTMAFTPTMVVFTDGTTLGE